MTSDGLQWKKVDLHVHTPGSKDDYQQPGCAPEEIVRMALAAGLDAMAVTDHNTGVWVDRMKAAAKGSGLVVFPGVEITAMGGKRNVHILAILDPAKGTDNVHDLLAKLDMPAERRGRTNSLAKGDVNQVIEVIGQSGAVALLAHADSSSGVLADMQGQGRISVIQNPRLLGVEITKDETAAFLDGSDPYYQRVLTTLKGSDSHAPEELGRRATYLKMGAMTIAALLQCLHDPQTRVRLSERPTEGLPRIQSMTVQGGFCDGMVVTLHEGLNTLLGGKGVGKSLLIEFLRFALDQPSDVSAVSEDMQSKLKKQLGAGGRISVTCQTAGGSVYEIQRQFDGVKNPLFVRDRDSGEEQSAEMGKIFPILAYSQNEVIYIAGDEGIQLKLIDRLLDVSAVLRAMNSVREQLRANTKEYVESWFASEKIADLDISISTYSARIAELDAALGDPRFADKKLWDRQHAIVDELSDGATSSAQAVDELMIDLVDPETPALEGGGKVAQEITDYQAALKVAITSLRNALGASLDEYGAAVQKADALRSEWEAKRATWEEEYESFLEEIGGHQQALSRARGKLVKEREGLQRQRNHVKESAARLEQHESARERLLDELDHQREEIYGVRAAKYEQLSRGSDNRLRLTVRRSGNRTGLVEGLIGVCQGMRIGQRFLATLAEAFEPRDLVKFILQRRQDRLESGGLTEDSAAKIVESIPGNADLLQTLLELPYEHTPEDLPSIEYRKEDGEYYRLDELSVGQKCTALLIIALSEGSMPIVIDQPEDALDVATLVSDVVKPIRRGKDERQFIITTHNPNVAVSADSDKYHVLKGTAATGTIVCAGAIDLEQVRKEVIDHLEGGPDAYRLRGRKYDIS